MAKTTAVAKREAAAYELALPTEDVREILEENLGGAALSPFELSRIPFPTSGRQMWDVEMAGDTISTKELTGIIVGWQDVRAYFPGAYGSTSGPPQCASADGIRGVGTPGGICARCTFNEFGSADNGGGKACREQRRLYLLLEGQILPMVLNVPPTSIRNVRDYFRDLSSVAPIRPFWGCVTGISLAKIRSNSGIDYSVAEFRVAADLTAEQRASVREYRAFMKATLEVTPPRSADDFLA